VIDRGLDAPEQWFSSRLSQNRRDHGAAPDDNPDLQGDALVVDHVREILNGVLPGDLVVEVATKVIEIDAGSEGRSGPVAAWQALHTRGPLMGVGSGAGLVVDGRPPPRSGGQQ
jgi:hypothetical protein